MKQWGCALVYASPALRDDVEVVTEAVRRNEGALRHASLRTQGIHFLLGTLMLVGSV